MKFGLSVDTLYWTVYLSKPEPPKSEYVKFIFCVVAFVQPLKECIVQVGRPQSHFKQYIVQDEGTEVAFVKREFNEYPLNEGEGVKFKLESVAAVSYGYQGAVHQLISPSAGHRVHFSSQASQSLHGLL